MKSIEFAKEVALPIEQLRSWGREELQEDPYFLILLRELLDYTELVRNETMFEYLWPLSEESKGEETLGNLYLLVCLA